MTVTSYRQQIDKILLQVLEPVAIPWWWETPDPAFGGITPQQMLDGGQGSTLLHRVESYLDPGFS
jgi:hypothetical protein